MKISDYINDNKILLLICFASGLFFSAILFLFGIGISELALLWICFLCIVLLTIGSDFYRLQKRTQHLLSVLERLNRKYLLAEVVDKPESELERLYFRLMKIAFKDMTDQVAQCQRLNHEYKDFIEQWIHEIKVPITGIQLLCENNKTDVTRKVLTQVEVIEQDVERVLFYARLGGVEKDYLIKEISLKKCIFDVLAKNKQFLIQNGVRVCTDAVTDTVFSDDKWICFIINQIMLNSIKYRSDIPPIIQMESVDMGNCISLSITDNGIGIKQSELNRVFDKGFVGSNGRSGKNSTGLGLYLCEQLCSKLGLGIDIESEVGRYTTVRLYFPKSSYLNKNLLSNKTVRLNQ